VRYLWQVMAGGPGADNKTLIATCVSCGKDIPAINAIGLISNEGGRRKIHSVCPACHEKGWRPPDYTGF
jgi:hypothetical protein